MVSLTHFDCYMMTENNTLQMASKRYDGEIDLLELLQVLWKGKWVIVITTLLFTISGLLYVLLKPAPMPVYKSEATVIMTGARSLVYLGALADISRPAKSYDQKELPLAILQSRPFIDNFIQSYDLAVPLMAGKKWNESEQRLEIDPALYDVKSKQWLSKGQFSSIPSSSTLYGKFKDQLTVVGKRGSDIVTLSIVNVSPIMAKQWLDRLIIMLNLEIKQKAVSNIQANIAYLQGKIAKTPDVRMKQVYYSLMGEQADNLMFAEVQNEFSLSVISPPFRPDMAEPVNQKRTLIIMLSMFLGMIFGVFIVTLSFFFTKKNDSVF